MVARPNIGCLVLGWAVLANDAAGAEAQKAASADRDGVDDDVDDGNVDSPDLTGGTHNPWGIGTGVTGGFAWRSSVAGPLYPVGLSLNVHLGREVSAGYITGIGLRGSWFVPPDKKLDSGTPARDLVLIEATVYWFHEFDWFVHCRVGLGPHVSSLSGDTNAINDAPLFGAEGSLELRIASADAAEASPSMWLGILVSHALGDGASKSSTSRERETTVKLALTFSLEQAAGKMTSEGH